MVPSSAIKAHDEGFFYVDESQLVTNLEYATAMARLKLWPAKDPLPLPDDIQGQGEYWHTVYNGNPDLSPSDYVSSYNTFLANK
jgi:hypothetical protein